MRSRVPFSPLVITALAVPPLLLLGCPANVIEVGYYVPVLDGGTTTGGTGGGGGAGGAPTCTPGATQPCYDGPAGTEGVGLCQPGSQTCAADGMSWGPCTGEVLPQPEDCATAEDENCDGQAPPCKGALLWSKSFGDTSGQHGSNAGLGVAADGAGDVFVTGSLEGTVDFGGGPLVGAGNFDVFLARFDPSGAHAWSNRFGDASGQAGAAVAVDGLGNILLTGAFGGALDLGGGPIVSTGADDVFLAKLAPTGAFTWNERLGDASGKEQAGFGIATDGSGNLIVVGIFSGTVDFGAGPVTSSGTQDVFVTKLDPNGGLVWENHYADAQTDIGRDVALDSAGNVVVAGTFGGTVDFGGGPLTGYGSHDVFVVKLDPNGGHVWSRHFGGAGGDVQHVGVNTNGAGSIALGGAFTGQIAFGGSSLVSAGGEDVFLAKLDPQGSHVWSSRFGDASPDQFGTSVAVDSGGAVVLAGYFWGAVDFGGGQLVSAGKADGFVAKFAANDGSYLWARRFGDGGLQQAVCVTTDPAGSVLLTGSFEGTMDLGKGPLVAIGQQDTFLAKFAP